MLYDINKYQSFFLIHKSVNSFKNITPIYYFFYLDFSIDSLEQKLIAFDVDDCKIMILSLTI